MPASAASKIESLQKAAGTKIIEAFGWTEDFTVPEPPVYPQGSRSASGIAE